MYSKEEFNEYDSDDSDDGSYEDMPGLIDWGTGDCSDSSFSKIDSDSDDDDETFLPPTFTQSRLQGNRRTCYTQQELDQYSSDSSDDDSYADIQHLIDAKVHCSYSDSDSDDDTLCSYEVFEDECMRESFVSSEGNNNSQELTHGPDFDMMDIDDNSKDYETDTEDDIENEAYYDKQDLDPFTIIQELSEDGDVYSLRYAKYLIEKEEMRRNNIAVSEGKGREKLKWTICADVKESDVPKPKQFNVKCGIYGFNFNDKPIISDGHNYRINFQNLFERLFP